MGNRRGRADCCLKTTLFPPQAEAVARAITRRGFAVFAEQRVGKTIISLAMAEAWRPDYLLIVTVPNATKVWRDQLAEHQPNLYCPIQIVTWKEMVNERTKLRRRLADANRSMIIGDEVHRAKRRGSIQSRAIRTLSKVSYYRLALTGTPIAQGIHDAWAVFNFVDPGIFGPFEEFASRFLVMGGFKGNKVIGYRNRQEYEDIIHQHSYRITLDEARGRSTIIQRTIVEFPLDAKSQWVYERVFRGLKPIVNGKKIHSRLIIARIVKMHQITGGSIIDENGNVQRIGFAKYNKLKEVLTELNEPIVIVCRFLHEIEWVARICDVELDRTVQIISGKQKYSGEFVADVIVMQSAAGVAIDLSRSKVIVFFSMDYSYINREQTRFRVLSYAQRQVRYIYLIARGTIDEDIYRVVTRKENLAKLVLDRYRRGATRGR